MKSTAPTVALALLGSSLAALLALTRGASGVPAFVALTASVSLVVVPVGLWIRRSRAASIMQGERALLLGVALSSLPLALFGGVLKSTTHHRPLGGATFAVAALVVLAACIGLAFRISGGARASTRSSVWQSLFVVCCAASLGGTWALALLGQAPALAIDFAALASAVAAAGFVKLPARLERLPAWLPWTGWALFVAAAIMALQTPGLSRLLTTETPVLFAALSWLGVGS